MKLKDIVKDFAPPILARTYRRATKSGIPFLGPFSSWQEAVSHSTGYNSDLIVDRVRNALLRVKCGEASCERDSVTFSTKQYSFPVLVGLLLAALRSGGPLTVLDVGGSLGSSYFLYRDLLESGSLLRWHVIEQQKFVECAKQYFENEELRFFARVDDGLRDAQPNIALFSGVLQYLEHPHEMVDAIVRHAPHHIVIDRTPFSQLTTDVLMVQVVPPDIYRATYPSWIFCASLVDDLGAKGYRLLTDWDSGEESITKGEIVIRYRGFLFERINDRK